jgi:hypothetical protein
MGRPPGSRNKGPDRNVSELLRALPKDVRAKAQSISEKTGLPVLIVVVDAMREGLTCVEVDLYDSLIRGRARAGKIVKESELDAIPLPSMSKYVDPNEVTDEQPEEVTEPAGVSEPAGESSDLMGAELFTGVPEQERSYHVAVLSGRPPEVIKHPARSEGGDVYGEGVENGDTASSVVHEAATYDPDDHI